MAATKTNTKYAEVKEGYGKTGLRLNLNLAQCQALAEFSISAKQAKEENKPLIYPDYLQPFFDLFIEFGDKFSEDLFSNEVQ